MIPLDINLNLDEKPWEDLDAAAIVPGTLERIGFLPNSTSEGRSTVALLVRLPDGTPVIAQTTLRLYNAAARAVAANPTAARELAQP